MRKEDFDRVKKAALHAHETWPSRKESSMPETVKVDPFKGLTIGRIVWAWVTELSARRPAIVTTVVDKAYGKVGLNVFYDPADPPVGIPIDDETGEAGVYTYSVEDKRLSWKWPERAQ
jgi:hypothetical protein